MSQDQPADLPAPKTEEGAALTSLIVAGSAIGALASLPEGADTVPVRLSAATRKKLQAATRNSFWTADTLIEQLIVDHLHSAYPAITYRTVEIASPGTFRAFDRKSLRPALGLLTCIGKYSIRVREENEDYQRLVRNFQDKGMDDPEAEAEAADRCLFKLQSYLEDCSEDSKIIYPDDFLVQQFVQRGSVTVA